MPEKAPERGYAFLLVVIFVAFTALLLSLSLHCLAKLALDHVALER